MRRPRFDYFEADDTSKSAMKPLHSPLDSLPTIETSRGKAHFENTEIKVTVPENELTGSDSFSEAQPQTNRLSGQNEGTSETDITRNITSNITRSITILPLLDDADFDDLREPATQVQSFRLTDKNKEWLHEITYRINKEIKRGRITQADVLRIAFKLFEKMYLLNKIEIKKILDRIA